MLRAHRRMHGFIWRVLALALPAILLLSYWARPDGGTQTPIQIAPAQTAPTQAAPAAIAPTGGKDRP